MITLAPFVRKNDKKTLSVRSTMRDRGFQINPFAWVISFCKNDDSWHVFSFPRETNDDIKWFQVIKFVRGSAGYLVLQKQCHFRHAFSFPSETKHDIWWLEVIRLVTGPYQMWGFAQGGTLCLGPTWHEPCSERVFFMEQCKKNICAIRNGKKVLLFTLHKLDMFNHQEPHHQEQIKSTAPPKIKVTTPGQTNFLFGGKQMEIGRNRHNIDNKKIVFPKGR